VIPADFNPLPLGFTAVSLDEWWLLGTAHCLSGSGTCGAIVRTTNGGSSFAGIPSPPGSEYHVTELAFANALDGYAFGPELWETSNGGSSWTKVTGLGNVQELQAASGEVYALFCAPSAMTGCQAGEAETLMRAAAGSRSWQKVATPASIGYDSQFALSGSNLYLLSSGAQPVLWYSANKGTSFSRRTYPCSAGLGGRAAAAANGSRTLWAACPTGTEAGASVSTNGGKRWRAVAGGFDNVLRLTAASSTVALAWPAQERDGVPPNALERTANGGASFSVVLGTSKTILAWAGFSDPTRAFAILETPTSSTTNTGLLYESKNGGATWSAVAIKS
jgi:hypothetical protein